MADWSTRVEQLLFDGETVEAEVEVGTATVAVTSHRVLAFTPQVDGKDYRAIDRPNVRDVERRHVDGVDVRARAAKLGVAAVVLLGTGAVFDPAALIPRPDLSAAEGADGVGSAVGVVDGMIGAFHALDTVLLALGGLLGALALALVGLHYVTRSSRVAVDVAGEEPPVLLPGRIDDESLARLRDAIAPPEPVADGER